MNLYAYPVNDYRSYLKHSDEVEQKYGLPDKKKYPMPDRDHVLSAIKFFNYVSPADEKELAKNILARIREYGITDINVGENNRFGKYYNADHLEHHGIFRMKWGVRRFQDKNGSLTAAGKKRYNSQSHELNAEIKNNLSPGLVKQLDDNSIALLNKNKEKLFSYADQHLKENSFSNSEIRRLRLSQSSGEYHDAFEAAFDRFRDERGFELKPKETTSSEKLLEKSGYKLSYTFDDGDEWYEKPYKNPNCFKGEMTSIINVSKSDSASEVNSKINAANDFANSFNKHDSVLRNSIADDIYDDRFGKQPDWLPEKSSFKKDIKCYGFTVYSSDEFEVNYDDGGHLGGHSLDADYDRLKKKVSNVAMNG